MSRFRDWDLKCKVYVGELSNSTEKEDLQKLFKNYGPLRNTWVARSPPGFAFVEFETQEDAEDAVKEFDGTRLNGRTIRVEMSTGRPRDQRRSGGGRYGGGGGGRYGGGGGRRDRDDGRQRRYSDDRGRRSSSRDRRRRSRSRSRSRSERRSQSPY